MSIWIVKPEEVKLDLVYTAPDGSVNPFWIKVKRYLTVGEKRRVMTAGWRSLRGSRPDEDGHTSQEIQIDWRSQTFARAEAYITSWSLTGANDAVMAVTREALESLNADVYDVIDEALKAHVASTEQEKKQKDGEKLPSATSA